MGAAPSAAAAGVTPRDVPADALALARGEQQNRDGWAARYRQIKAAKKAAKQKS